MKKEKLKCKRLFRQERIKGKRGDITLILAITILSLILMVGLNMPQWIVSSFNASKSIVFSAPAYYAAESGIERTLLRVVKEGGLQEQPAADSDTPYLTGSLTYVGAIIGTADFKVYVVDTNPFRAKSIGKTLMGTEEISRAIEINWEKSW